MFDFRHEKRERIWTTALLKSHLPIYEQNELQSSEKVREMHDFANVWGGVLNSYNKCFS